MPVAVSGVEALNPLTRLKPDSVTESSAAGLDASQEIARGSKLCLLGCLRAFGLRRDIVRCVWVHGLSLSGLSATVP